MGNEVYVLALASVGYSAIKADAKVYYVLKRDLWCYQYDPDVVSRPAILIKEVIDVLLIEMSELKLQRRMLNIIICR